MFLVGPTGVGKSALALELAARLDAEIVGADAFQVYAGLPVLTAQPSAADRARVPHHLIGEIPVEESFDAYRYAKLATSALADIHARGKCALMVGGTGLYVRALTLGFDDVPPANSALRAELAAMDLSDLVRRLEKADPHAPTLVDIKNRRRVERAIEICELSGRPLAEFRSSRKVEACGLMLVRERQELRDRIARNVRAMLEGGAIEEVRMTQDLAGPTARRAIGWSEISAMLRGELTRQECEEAIVTATRKYAKRQLTWFRNQTTFPSLDLSDTQDSLHALESALRALRLS